MDSEIEIDVAGEVVSRQALLNGTESVVLDGRSPDGTWSMAVEFSWNRGLVESSGEGDITVTRMDGAELFGSLAEARATEAAYGALQVQLRYDLDGGSGAFDGATGVAHGSVQLGADTFASHWRIRLTVPEPDESPSSSSEPR